MNEKGPVKRLRQGNRQHGRVLLQPVEQPRCGHARHRKATGSMELDPMQTRTAQEVMLVVLTLEWHVHQRCATRALEHHAQQQRMPVHAPSMRRGHGLDTLTGDIAVGRGKIEVKIHCRQIRCRSGVVVLGVVVHASSIAIAVASPPPIHRLATPRRPPLRRSAPIRLTRMRAPEAPIG